MVLFSKGMGLKNDVFCLISFLTPLDVSKTSTNIWKHLGIFQNPSEDSKNTKIGLLDQILASLKRTNPCKCGLKNHIFAYFSTFFQFFVINGPVDLWKQISASKNLAGGTTSTIFGHLEQILALKMATSNPENWLKNQIFANFSTFFHIFGLIGPVHQ